MGSLSSFVIFASFLLLLLLSNLSSISAFNCTLQSSLLQPSARLTALDEGIHFTSVATPSSTAGFSLCFSIGGGGADFIDDTLGFSSPVNGQLDTGSTGVVVPRPTLRIGSYKATGVCHVFDFSSSLNSYFGEMVLSHMRIFGADDDGRYWETNSMPVMAVEYTCKGSTCLSSLASFNQNCSAIRAIIPSLSIWTATTPASATAMFGVGMNRGLVNEGYSIGPNFISRNPMLHINLDPLAAAIAADHHHHHDHRDDEYDENDDDRSSDSLEVVEPVPLSSMCENVLENTVPATTTRMCAVDPAQPDFYLNASALITYGYIINASLLLPLYTSPSNSDPPTPSRSSSSSSLSSSPLSSPVFSCQSLPSLPPVSTSSPPPFTCWDTTGLIQRLEILSSNSSSSVWTGFGTLLCDTGLSYFIDNTPSYPCLSGIHTVRLSFPFSPNATSTPYVWNFDVDWSSASGSGTAIYYNTYAASSSQQPPTSFRLWQTALGTPCTNISGVDVIGVGVNGGRFVFNSFAMYVDFVNGVQGFASASAFAQAFQRGEGTLTDTATHHHHYHHRRRQSADE